MPDASAAERLNEDGRARNAAGDLAGAEAAYREAALLAPAWSVPVYNLALLFKYAGRWEESFEWNRRAAELAPDDQASWWNLGIAATALSRWSEARRAWSQCGIQDPGGDDPPDYRFGRIPIRLDPDGDGEVVWARRLDPARSRILSIPLPSSEYRWDDIVLQDGAAEGHRVVDDREYPVFNVLQRLVPSTTKTFIVELASVDDRAVRALEDIAHEMGGAAENWGETTRILCRQCSFGVPHAHDGPGGDPAHPHCGLAAPSRVAAASMIERWLDASDSADLVTWYELGSMPGRT